MTLAENYAVVRQRIEDAIALSGRKDNVKIIGITKTRTPEEIDQLLTVGIDTIGENRIQELVDKYDKINSCFDIQVVGQLQTNKVKYTIDRVSCIQSLDRTALAEEIDKRACAKGRVMDVLVEVNLTGNPDRGGVEPAGVVDFCDGLGAYGGLRLKGLMAVAPLDIPAEARRGVFARVYGLYCRVRDRHPDADRLSMGMSSDYYEAILEGATEIRLGTALFGKREKI